MGCDVWINTKLEFINAALRGYLRTRYPEIIYDAMNYSVFAGGKRLRPLLLISAYEMLGGKGDAVLPFACAVELIHAYSLVHDDLPAMDDDDFRRGKPSNHKRFGEGIAILAGDGLLNLAFEIMAKQSLRSDSKECPAALLEIASCAGVSGMIGGQVVDLINEGKEITEQTLLYLQKNKTGKLIKASVCAGAHLASANDETICKLSDFAFKLGLAFQIKDDILDVTGDIKILGKQSGSDEKNKKQTYVSMFGIQKAKDDYTRISDECFELLNSITGEKTIFLELVDQILKREY